MIVQRNRRPTSFLLSPFLLLLELVRSDVLSPPLRTPRAFDIDIEFLLRRARVNCRRIFLKVKVEMIGVDESRVFVHIVGRGIGIITIAIGYRGLVRREQDVVPDDMTAAREKIDPVRGARTELHRV